MSLFGDSPPGSRSLLFSGEPGIFGDDDNGGDNGAWAGATSPTSRLHNNIPKHNRSQNLGDVVKSLLTEENAEIPRDYYSVYEKLVSEFGDGADGKVEARGATDRVLDEAEVFGEERSKIWDVVVGKKDLVGRGEVWCLLAMTGLVQEGEHDIGVDSVDVRRSHLPVPRLKGLAPPPQPYQQNGDPTTPPAEDPQSPKSPTADKPAFVSRNQPSTPISTAPVRAQNAAALFSSSVDDPWGAHQSAINNAVVSSSSQAAPSMSSPPQQHTDNFSALDGSLDRHTEEDLDEHEPDDLHAALRNNNAARTSVSSTWGTDAFGGQQGFGTDIYTQSILGSGFNDHPGLGARHGSFGGLGGNRVNGSDHTIPNGIGASGIERIKAAMKAPEEHVVVNILPEKEGMFMFQHRNYQITSARRGSRVVRRYSDFVWLLDCLHKRYPFRALPLLPPKRLAVNGHHLADTAFLERRRRGLHRFVNALVRHPTLSQEQLVIMFLTVPTELSVWRKQATFSVVDEFANRSLPADLEASLPRDLTETFETVRSGLRKSAEIYIQLCQLVDRLEKRHEGIAADYGRFAGCLSSLTDASEATYAVDTGDIPLLNDGLSAVAKSLNQSRALLEDEAKAWDCGVLEDLKRQRDTLVSMRELFERYDRLAGNTIPALQKRIESNKKKLEVLRNKPQELKKPGEVEKVEEAVKRDLEDIEKQRVRGILIRECVRDELVFFQGSQYHVSKLHQEWSTERVKYAELQAEGWRGLQQEVEGMPTGE